MFAYSTMPIVKNDSGHELVQVSNLAEIAVTTDGMETLQETTNTKLTGIDTRLDEIIGHTNNTTELGDGSNQLRSVCLGYDRTNEKARSLLVDAAGKLACSTSPQTDRTQDVNLSMNGGAMNAGTSITIDCVEYRAVRIWGDTTGQLDVRDSYKCHKHGECVLLGLF